MTFIDDGIPYDPLAKADPDIGVPIEERPIGGMGIFMVKKLADMITYKRYSNRNFLTVGKRLGPA